MKTLILTVGLPRSGKSTWVQEQRSRYGWPVVSPDAIRLAIHGERFLASAEPHVWAVAKTMVPALFLSGHDVVLLDATNTTYGQRAQWCSQQWQSYYKLFDTPIDVCIQRAIDTNQNDLVEVIHKMEHNWEGLRSNELPYLEI